MKLLNSNFYWKSLLILFCVGIFSGANANTTTVKVGFGGNVFSPANFNICLGDTIYFVWSSGTHNVHITNPATPPSSDLMAAGDTFKYAPQSAINYSFQCDYHFTLGMVGTFTVNPSPTANAGSDISICAGSSTTLNASGNGTYAWSPSIGLSCTTCANPVTSPTITTTYTVTVTNSCGSISDSVVVTVNPIPFVDLGADTSQCGGSVFLDAGNIGSSYLWSNGATTQLLNVSVSNTFSVKVTNQYGCIDSDTILVKINPLMTLSVTSTDASCITCPNGSASLIVSGGTPGYTYVWMPLTQTTSTVTGILPGNYTVCVTDAAGCSSCANFFVGPFCDTMKTTFAGGNRHDGNMFDITAIHSVVISGFDANIVDDGDGKVGLKIYYKTGTHIGFETNPSVWTVIDTVIIKNPAATGLPTPIPIQVNVAIPAGKTCAFYITTSSTAAVDNLEYKNGTTLGDIYLQDQNIKFKEGVGKEYPFGATYSPRIWNGIIHYCASNSVGIDDQPEQILDVKVFPNPFSTSTTFEIHGEDIKDMRVVIYDIHGKQVAYYKVPGTTKVLSIDRSNLSSGLYFYKVETETKIVSSGKLVVE